MVGGGQYWAWVGAAPKAAASSTPAQGTVARIGDSFRGEIRRGGTAPPRGKATPRGRAVRPARPRAAGIVVGDCPLQHRADEDRGVVDPAARTAVGAAAAVDLVAVVLVVGHPVDVIQRVVVVLQRVVVVVPELLEALLLRRQALVALGEDV